MTHLPKAPHVETIQFAGTTTDILVPAARCDGAFSLLRIATPPGCWTPPHMHRNEDETVLVLSGSIRVETEAGQVDLSPGVALTLPRGQAHRLGNVGSVEAEALVLCTPGGFDGFVRSAARPAQADDPAMTEADIARLVQAAPQYGIELLGADALSAAASQPAAAPATPETLDVFGVSMQLLAELGANDDDVSLMRGQIPPGGVVMLHSHADPELFYVVTGAVEVSLGPVGAASWRTIESGRCVAIQGAAPHALRNRGDMPVDIVLVSTRRMALFLREVGRSPAEVPPGPPSEDRLLAFAVAAQTRQYWLADRSENEAIGIAAAPMLQR